MQCIFAKIIPFFFLDTDNKNVSVEKNSSDKFLDTNRNYNSLTEYEKNIVDSFLRLNPEINNQLKDGYGEGESYKNYIKLKSYFNSKALLYIPSGKGGWLVSIYNMNTGKTTQYQNIYVFGNIVESDKYVIFLNEGNYEQDIQYLKFGEIDLKNIPNSMLTKSETYVKQGGFGNTYEATLKENLLKISVFKQENGVDTPNTKLREVEFVLQ